MADIFGKETKFRPANFVTADAMILIISGGGRSAAEYLVQQVSIQFNQPLNRVYEIGSANVYFAPGRPVGTVQLGRIVGAQSITALLGEAGSGVWTTDGNVNSHMLTFFKRGGNVGAYHLSYIITGAVVDGYSSQTDANSLLVQETASLQFAGLSFG